MVRSRRANLRSVRRRPRRRMGNNIVTEVLISDVKIGKIGVISGAQLTNVPLHSVWRPVSVTVQAAPITDAPFAVQALLYSAPASGISRGIVVASSRVILISQVPRTLTVRYPRSGSWYQPLSVQRPEEIVNLTTICTGTSDPGTVCYTVTMRIAVRNEVVSPTCPVSFGVRDPDPPDNISDYSLV